MYLQGCLFLGVHAWRQAWTEGLQSHTPSPALDQHSHTTHHTSLLPCRVCPGPAPPALSCSSTSTAKSGGQAAAAAAVAEGSRRRGAAAAATTTAAAAGEAEGPIAAAEEALRTATQLRLR